MEKKTSIWGGAWKNSASQSTARHLWGLVTLTVRGDAPGATQTCSGSSGSRSHLGWQLAAFWAILLSLWAGPIASASHTVQITSLPGQDQLGVVNALKNPLYKVE